MFSGLGEVAASVMTLLALVAALTWVYRLRRQHRLEREKSAALAERVRKLEGLTLPVAGVDQGEKTWTVTVGGEEVELKALSPLEFASALEELPEFLYIYASEKVGDEPSYAKAEQLVERSKRWIEASAVDKEGVRLERLTVPEAMHALAAISRFNGVDAQLATFFQERLGGADAGPRRQALQGESAPASAN